MTEKVEFLFLGMSPDKILLPGQAPQWIYPRGDIYKHQPP